MTYFIPIFLFLSTLSSGLLIIIFPKLTKKTFELLLLGSGGYLFSITLIHLLPHVFEHAHNCGDIQVGHYLLFGFFLQLFLDMLGGGVAHGHTMCHCTPSSVSSTILFSALFLHSCIEGFIFDSCSDNVMLLAIVLHKLPAAFMLTTVLYHRKQSNKKIIAFLVLFSLATPFTFIFSQYLSVNELVTQATLYKLSALATGSLLHVAIVILFEANPEHKPTKIKWLALFASVLLALATNQYIQH